MIYTTCLRSAFRQSPISSFPKTAVFEKLQLRTLFGGLVGSAVVAYGAGKTYQWLNSKQPVCKVSWPNGTHDKDEMLGGVPHGRGTVFLANGDRYEGEFRCGQVIGKGTYFFASGNRYEGEVSNKVEVTGKGTLFFSNGGRYEGKFINGEFVGKGVFFKADGRKIEVDNDGFSIAEKLSACGAWVLALGVLTLILSVSERRDL